MEQWEYLTTFMEASTRDKQVADFVRETFDKKPKRHSPEALIPELNRLGDEGWELVLIEPVARVGRKEDIQFGDSGWSAIYFCVMKRRKPGSFVPVQVTPRTNSSSGNS